MDCLPTEIWRKISLELSPREVCALRCVSIRTSLIGHVSKKRFIYGKCAICFGKIRPKKYNSANYHTRGITSPCGCRVHFCCAVNHLKMKEHGKKCPRWKPILRIDF